MNTRPSRRVFLQMRRKTLSVMTRPREGVPAAMTRKRGVLPTPSSMRLNTIRSLSGRRGREHRQFRLQNALAPILSPVVPQFVQGKARTLSSLSLPLWTPHAEPQMSQLIAAQCRRQLLRYTPQRSAGMSHKHFNFCILLLIGLHIQPFS